MKLLKGLLLIGLLKIILIAINACSDKSFYYKWEDIFIDNLSNHEITSDNSMSQSNFGMRVNIINTKSDAAQLYIPAPISSAYAGIKFGTNYYNIDNLKKLNILLLTTVNDRENLQIVTDMFVPEKYDVDDLAKFPIDQLIEQINEVKFEPVEHFDLFLNESFEENITGRFIIQLELSDDRILSDTTQLIDLTL